MIPSIRRKGAFFSPAICLKVAVVRWSGWRGGAVWIRADSNERKRKRNNHVRRLHLLIEFLISLAAMACPPPPPPEKSFPRNSPRGFKCVKMMHSSIHTLVRPPTWKFVDTWSRNYEDLEAMRISFLSARLIWIGSGSDLSLGRFLEGSFYGCHFH